MSVEPAIGEDGTVRATIDFVTGVLLIFVGAVGVVSGTLIAALADREIIADLVADGTIEADVLTDAELIELVYATLLWGGIGLSVAGGVILLAAVGFAIGAWRRYRSGRNTYGLVSAAVIGAVVTLLTSFVPFSPIIGGIVAGVLYRPHPWRGLRVGLVVGVLVALPVLIVLAVLAVGYAQADLVWASLLVVLVGVFSVALTLLFAAVGGYAGGYFRTGRSE